MVILILAINSCIGRQACVTINIRVQHFQRSLERAFDSVTITTRSVRFAEKYNSLSSETSSSNWASLWASFGYSTAQSAAFASVASSASNQENERHEEKSRERTYQPGWLQVFRKTIKQIIIDGQSAKEDYQEIIQVRSEDNPMSLQELQTLDEDYIFRYYGQRNRPGTYIERNVKKLGVIITWIVPEVHLFASMIVVQRVHVRIMEMMRIVNITKV